MEWHYIFLIIICSLFILMLSGLEIAFCFLLLCVCGMYFYFGGTAGLEQLVVSMYTTCKSFILIPIPLFVFMGEVMFHSGIAPLLVRVLDKWLGRIPGRLSLLAVGAGTLFSTLTGTSIASVSMLGSALVPEMEKQGYKKPMTLGPILGSGGLAMMIPPSGLAVLLGAIAQVSIGRILMAIVIPGFVMAVVYAAYIIIRCWLQPSIAPVYEVEHIALSEKIGDTVKYVFPQGLVIFLVVGVIFIGVATPSEAAATGAVGTVFLAFCYRKMSWKVIKDSIKGTVGVTGMIFLIIAGATAFSQILAFSGATVGLADMVTGLPAPPIVIIMVMMLAILFLGGFLDVVAIMMITLPIFIPVVEGLGYSLVWFCVLFLLNIEMAMTTPPFGMSLFVMKGVASSDTRMKDIYLAGFPFLACDMLVMAFLLIFPGLALWLPGLMQ